MRAYQVDAPGGPEVLVCRELPDPEPEEDKVVIKIRAFGLNRSELYTRRGESGDAVTFPRVLGIECVGEVVAAPGTDLQPGQKVAAAMGQMGRRYHGGYAEVTKVPRSQVMPFESDLPWSVLGALPETYFTAWISIVDELKVGPGQTILVRGGTSSVGMAATSIAKHLGATVIATTRREAKREALERAGVDHVVIDDGSVHAAVLQRAPGGVHGVLELVGSVAAVGDSMQAIRSGGVMCHTGLLGDEWDKVLPTMPDGVRYVFGSSETVEATRFGPIMQTIVERVAAGHYRANVFRTFRFDELRDAHRLMESNGATGKLVVLAD